MNVSQRFGAGKLAKSLKRHSQKLRAVVAAMALMVVSCSLWAQTTYSYSKVTTAPEDWSGDYIIVAGDKAFNGQIVSNWGNYETVTDSEGTIEMDTDISVTVAPSEVDDSKYTIYLNATSKYLAEVTGNAIADADDASEDTEWEFSMDENGCVAISCAGTTRHMRCNSTSGFRCYDGTTGTKPFLYKMLPPTSPIVYATSNFVDFSYDLNNGPSVAQSFSVSALNLTADLTVSVPEDTDFELCLTADGTYSSSVSITPNEGTVASTDVYVRMKAGLDMATYNATITITSTGATSKTTDVAGFVIDPSVDRYTKVTAAPENDDWSGEYLITNVSENGVMAMSGQEYSTGSSPYSFGAVEDISDNIIGGNIISNATIAAMNVTIAATDGGYSIYFEDLGYLGWNDGNTLDFDENITDGQNEWTLSFSNGTVSINNVSDSNRKLQYNLSANPKRFACYTSNQKAITLFKLVQEVQEAPANPTFSAETGTYYNDFDLTLACETEGATIYYTLNGNDPTAESTEYTAAIAITVTTTVKAIAIKNGVSSEIVSATYTMATYDPTFSAETGTYYNDFDLTLACETEDATIYYTLNGDDPTAESTEYTAAIAITATTTVKAIAIKNGISSEIASATYTMATAAPTFSQPTGTYLTSVTVALSCETEGATIYYTLNNADAEEYNPENPFTFTETTAISAFAEKNSVRSDTVSATYTITNLPIVATPTFTPNGGNFVNSVDVTLACATEDAAIYYTTDGSEPTVAEGTLYDAPFSLNATTTVKAIAVKDEMTNSAVAEATFTKLEQVATPTFTPNGGDFVNSVDVTLACATEEAAIYYTTDGNEPTVAEGTPYVVNTPITLTATSTVKAIAVKEGMANSAVAEANFTKLEQVATPTITPNGGNFEGNVEVTLACETEDAAIYYTTDGNNPTIAEENLYSEPFTLNETTTVKAIAVKNGMADSEIAEATFNKVLPIVATPTITPNGGTFETSVNVTLACETEDAAIYYTLDGSEPTDTTGTLYDVNNPITLTATTTVKAIAVKENMQASAIAEATFTKQPSALTFTKIASHDLITTEDIYMIVDVHSGKALTSANGSSSAPDAVDVTIVNDTIISGVIADELQWKFAEEEGGYRIYPKDDTEKWLYSINDNNGVRVGTNDNKVWEIDVTSAEQPNYHGLMNVALSRYLGVYNNANWRAYTTIHNNIANSQIEFFVLGEPTPVVATPTFSVEEGIYTTEQSVEISCATEGATIRYTLDGTDPTEESEAYTMALTISEPTTVKAKAYKQDYIASGIAEAFYNVITTPEIIVDAETLNFENVNETKTLNVSSLNLTENITVAVTENFTVDTETITMNTEATLTVTFTGSAATTGTLTLTSGETVKTVALVATPLVASEGCYYPIAEALTDWTGEYLITYTDLTAETINALNGIQVNNNGNTFGTAENVFEYYADGVIASNLATEACKVTIAATDNGYSMYLNRIGYLGLNVEENRLYSNEEYAVERDEWTVSVNNEEMVITNVQYPDRILKWNNSNPRFACYSNTASTLVTLYKLGTIPTVATPVFTPAAGYYEEAQNVTITCATEGATIYYTIDGTTPTNESTQYTEAIAVSQNTTIKAIAYLGEEASFVATARYTFPNFVENIAALYEIENTTETYILTGDVTFVYRNGKNIYVKDETAGLLVFDQSNVVTTEYTEGDVISGGIIGTINMYHGMLEFVPTFNTAASTQNTGAVAPTVITVEQLLSNEYVSQLVKVENVAVETGATYTEGQTGDNVTFSQNGSSALLRNNFKTLDMTIGDNTNWDITGFAAIFDENIQIFPRDNDDVTIVTSVEELTAEISIYPNPTSNVINIAANGMNVERVELANVDGQIVSSETVASDMVTLSLEAQPAGMYFVRIYTADEVIVRKVTKF